MAFDLTSTAFDNLRNPETFEGWLRKVDVAFMDKLGIEHEDWPDQTYYDWFEDGVEPMEAVALAVENEYGFAACCELGLEEWL